MKPQLVPVILGGRRGVRPFDPIDLFTGGVQGAWYDPSDVLLNWRTNLLTYSQEFDNAAWTKDNLNAFGSGSVANTTATLDPLGGNTADYIQENTSTSKHRVYQTLGSSGVTYTFSCYIKAAQRTWAYLNFGDIPNRQAWFNLTTGQVGTVTSGLTAAIQSVGNGWYLCSISRTASAAPNFDVGIADADNSHTYTGDGTSGIYVWGADLRTGSSAGTYQRIAAATDYATAGFLPYLYFVTDDSFGTNSINFSATDKMSVCAGVTKLSDAATAVVTELSATINSNNGSFVVYTSNPGGSTNYQVVSKGTFISAATATGFAAPVTNVLTSLMDISGDSIIVRANATVSATGTGDQGTGNFGNYPLYIGRRGGASLPFNGNLYQLIVCGKTLSADELASTEAYVNARTGAY